MKLKNLVYLLTFGTLLLASGCASNQSQSVSYSAGSQQTTASAQEAQDGSLTGDGNAEQLTAPVLPDRIAFPDESKMYEASESDFESVVDEINRQYDAWAQQGTDRLTLAEGNQDGLMAWWKTSMPVLLSGAEDNHENRIYSPINTYLALSMLAETVDGEARTQLLKVLDADTIETVRSRANAVWNANYVDDGSVTTLLGSSLWLSDSLAYRQSALDTLAESYYAASFRGQMGSSEYNAMLQNWINEQTGNLLQDSASQLEFDPSTVLSIAATIYYRARWQSEFDASETTTDTFHGADGDTDCSFMHMSEEGDYYCGDHFSAIVRPLKNSGQMVLILPDEGVAPEELTSDSQVLDLLTDLDGYENKKSVTINESIPKFDVSSNADLSDGMQKLGITDVFDADKADFSPILEDTTQKASLSQVSHAVRVKIDEEGVEAAAYTMMAVCGSMLPPDETVDFVLDRPFLFIVRSDTGAPLFAGVVNQVQ